jgi:hypothetical protein
VRDKEEGSKWGYLVKMKGWVAEVTSAFEHKMSKYLLGFLGE